MHHSQYQSLLKQELTKNIVVLVFFMLSISYIATFEEIYSLIDYIETRHLRKYSFID